MQYAALRRLTTRPASHRMDASESVTLPNSQPQMASGDSNALGTFDLTRQFGKMTAVDHINVRIDPMVLSRKGSLFLTRPTLINCVATRSELEQRAGDVLGAITQGELKLHIEYIYPLSQAAQAHRDLEGRKTSGKDIADPMEGPISSAGARPFSWARRMGVVVASLHV